MAREYSPIWPILDQTVGERKQKEQEEEEESRERGSTFSLDFWVIRSSSFGGARGKALPRKESFATRPEFSPTWFILWIRAIRMVRDVYEA